MNTRCFLAAGKSGQLAILVVEHVDPREGPCGRRSVSPADRPAMATPDRPGRIMPMRTASMTVMGKEPETWVNWGQIADATRLRRPGFGSGRGPVPLSGLIRPRTDLEQGGFAAAVGAEHGQEIARVPPSG